MALLSLSICIVGTSTYVMWDRVKRHVFDQHAPAPPIHFTGTDGTKTEKNEPPTTVVKTQPQPTQQIEKPEPKSAEEVISTLARKISFRYRDPIPKRVVIVGDFNQWSPKLMNKDNKITWSITLMIKPGSYAYNFIVDGKIIRDPSNVKMKEAGQKIPSSLLLVKTR